MLTYGDVMTLLLTFFVLLLSFSSVQEAKFQEAASALQAALGVLKSQESVLDHAAPQKAQEASVGLEEIEGQMSEIVEIVRSEELSDDVDVIPTRHGYTLRISSPVLFDLASAEIRPQGAGLLSRLADYLLQFEYPIRIEGHTDNLPIRTERYPSNWELSTARALSVLKLMNERGIVPTRLSAVGYGEFKPLLENDTPERRQVNRRVELYVEVDNEDEMIDLEEMFGR
jgi:chemotaxis protein MotB